MEQRGIAAFAWTDETGARSTSFIAEQRRLIELLKEKRQAVISHAVTKGLNPDAPMKPSGIDWLGDVPGALARQALEALLPRSSTGGTP